MMSFLRHLRYVWFSYTTDLLVHCAFTKYPNTSIVVGWIKQGIIFLPCSQHPTTLDKYISMTGSRYNTTDEGESNFIIPGLCFAQLPKGDGCILLNGCSFGVSGSMAQQQWHAVCAQEVTGSSIYSRAMAHTQSCIPHHHLINTTQKFSQGVQSWMINV